LEAATSRAIERINRTEIATELDAVKEPSGPEAANQARAALSALFAWAIKKGLCGANPVIGTEKPAKSVKRERVLSDEELSRIWRTLTESNYGRIVKLLILTGSRRQEIGGLRWSGVDLERQCVLLPGDRTKNTASRILSRSHGHPTGS
jgi:integrase